MKKILLLLITAIIFSGCTSNPETPTNNQIPQDNDLNSENTAENEPEPMTKTPDLTTPLPDDLNISANISTDKNEYGSYEHVKIKVTLESSSEIKDATIRVWGITPYKHNFIEAEKTADLNAGENTIEFIEETPHCTAGCGGVYPGPYDLHATVKAKEKELANAKTTITLTNN